ncbi:lytic murein transglycosylase [Mesorhizobium loti]|uniref:Lytic murein transglycosylase n=1 Tax=Mesorhizobium jarvisii TaxID=1777867 RepID=A0A6M7TB19_9HYPH|nr:lytic murein transglycosylase [Mesorhizobium jarvisii]QKD07843.1 lytic murein transglycosylase [Mesorhizobium loti]RJT35620.1 lytic murein transglycosylase [Mesorhizobium jarvisii]
MLPLEREPLRPGTPLCPTGHLPRKGGDRLEFPVSPIISVAGFAPAVELLISPLAGEMAGRPAGGG